MGGWCQRNREIIKYAYGGLPTSCSNLKPALRSQQDKEKKKKESILDLSKYIDKTIRVKFQGGREGECLPQGSLTQSLAEVTASKGSHLVQAFQ